MNGKPVSRRDFVRLAAAATATSAAAGPFFHFSAHGRLAPWRDRHFPQVAAGPPRTLKIAKWAHFLPEYDAWFEGVLAAEWGRRHDTEVIVDRIPIEEIGARRPVDLAPARMRGAGVAYPVAADREIGPRIGQQAIAAPSHAANSSRNILALRK